MSNIKPYIGIILFVLLLLHGFNKMSLGMVEKGYSGFIGFVSGIIYLLIILGIVLLLNWLFEDHE